MKYQKGTYQTDSKTGTNLSMSWEKKKSEEWRFWQKKAVKKQNFWII